MTMNSDSLKNRLQLADETISILRSSNSQLDRNLSVLQSDFSVLESLLIESGQTLQKLQEMVRQTPIFSFLTETYQWKRESDISVGCVHFSFQLFIITSAVRSELMECLLSRMST